MSSDDLEFDSSRKRGREAQDELPEMRKCRRSGCAWEEADELDAPSLVEDVDEERVQDVIRELMEEIGMAHSHPPHGQYNCPPISASNSISDSATSSASCSSKLTEREIEFCASGRPDQNFCESGSASSSCNNPDYNWLHSLYGEEEDHEWAVDLQVFPWEEEAQQWWLTGEDSEISDWFMTIPHLNSDLDRQMEVAGDDRADKTKELAE